MSQVPSVPKRICAIHDLSCFGRCALTVIIPTLSAMGNQVVPLPTALLSTHTGGFENMYFLDLSDSISKISEHFSSLGISFDAIYSGFLGNDTQIDSVSDFIDDFSSRAKRAPLVLVDPVMGDDGKLYSTYTKELMHGMKRLCAKADIITPNLTEAFFLADREFCDTSLLSEREAYSLARELRQTFERSFKNKKTVITGIPFRDNKFATYGFDAEENKEYFYVVERVKLDYPGTGDLFASLLLGKMLDGCDFYSAIAFASDFVGRIMEYSAQLDTPMREGVAIEAFLGELACGGK